MVLVSECCSSAGAPWIIAAIARGVFDSCTCTAAVKTIYSSYIIHYVELLYHWQKNARTCMRAHAYICTCMNMHMHVHACALAFEFEFT